jgi:predicted AAA+ superfamily ATPase
MSADWARLAERIDAFLARLERLLPSGAEPVDWKSATAFRWRKYAQGAPLGQGPRNR